MAQSFLANSATRLHPIEWSTGTAAGVAAAAMSRNGWDSRQAFEHIADIQALIREKTPIDWTINGETLSRGKADGEPRREVPARRVVWARESVYY